MVIGMCLFDFNGCIIYVNLVFCCMIGWMEVELVGCMLFFLYWLFNEIGEMQKYIELILCGKVFVNGMELCMMCCDGMSFYVWMYVLLFIDVCGWYIGWMSFIMDIIELKCVCEDLVVVYDCFIMVFESLDVVVLVFLIDKVELLFVNCYYCQFFGWEVFGYLQFFGNDVNIEDVFSDVLDFVDVYVGLFVLELMFYVVDVWEIYVLLMQKWFEVWCCYIQWVDGYFVQMQIVIDIIVCKVVEEMICQYEECLQFIS